MVYCIGDYLFLRFGGGAACRRSIAFGKVPLVSLKGLTEFWQQTAVTRGERYVAVVEVLLLRLNPHCFKTLMDEAIR